MLNVHVFELERQKLAVFLRRLDDLGGLERVDMHLDAPIRLRGDDRIAVQLQILDERVEPETLCVLRTLHQLEQKLHAVAVLEHGVLVEQFETDAAVRACGRFRRRHGDRIGQLLAVQLLEHSLDDVDIARAAAVDHARFLQDRKQFRRCGEALFHFRDIDREQGFHRGSAVDLTARPLDALARDGQDRSLDRAHDRAVRHAVGADERVAKIRDVRRGAARKLLIKAGKQLRQNDAGISARAEQHPLRQHLEIRIQLLAALRKAETLFEGQTHIRARIAVGDRKHVQRIDLIPMLLEVRKPVAKHFLEQLSVDSSCVHAVPIVKTFIDPDRSVRCA